jgi:YesN/AraC family two-component response regulator
VIRRGLGTCKASKFMLLYPLVALHHVESDCKYCQVLMSDIRMPALTGFQLVRKVKDLRPETKVIMMTMFEVSKPEFDAVFPSTPIDAVIRKPFVPSQLIEKIRGFLAPITQQKTRRMEVHDHSWNSKSLTTT